MPEEPGGHRLGRDVHEKDALRGDEHVLQPHLTVQLVVAARHRGHERIRMARGDLAAQHGHARRVDGHDERQPMRAALDPAVAADVDVLRVGRARVHAHLAADDDARVGLADQTQRNALARVLAHAVADRGGAGREREKAPGAGDRVAMPRGVRDLLRRDVALLDRVEDAERDQVAVGGSVRDVAGALERRLGEAAAHPAQVVGAARQDVRPGDAAARTIGGRQDDILPLRVGVTVVPRDVLVHRRARGRMDRDVLDEALANDPQPAPVAQRLAVLGARPHGPKA